MGLLEPFLGAAIAGFGFLLAAVAVLAWRRARDRKMAVMALAFVVAGAGGALLLIGEAAGGAFAGQTVTLLASCFLATLVLLYGALFARRS